MLTGFRIGNKELGDDAPCFLIAEVALAHDGSLGTAHAYIEAAAEAGADAVKFQTHIASEESTRLENFRVNIFPQDRTRYDYWERTAFSEDQWRDLKSHAETLGLEFLSSPFSVAAVALLRRIGVKGWKIGSGETNNLLMLEEVALHREPVLLSTGMSSFEEVTQAVDLLSSKGVPLLLMQCTNRYPCPPDRFGLNLINEYRQRYGVPVGLSDHSGEIAPGLAALTLGAKAIEVHVTWSKKCFGPDVKASLTFEQFSELSRGIRLLEQAFACSVDKDMVAQEMLEMRRLFTKGLVAKETIESGTPIERHHLDAKKPCVGIPVAEYKNVLGKVTRRRILQNEHIVWEDLA